MNDMTVVYFVNTYLQRNTPISIVKTNGMTVYEGTVKDLPIKLVANADLVSISGLGKYNDVIIIADVSF